MTGAITINNNGTIKTFTPLISKDPNSKQTLAIWPHGGNNGSSASFAYQLQYAIFDNVGKCTGGDNLVSQGNMYDWVNSILPESDNIDYITGKSNLYLYNMQSRSRVISIGKLRFQYGIEYMGGPFDSSNEYLIKFPTAFDIHPYVFVSAYGGADIHNVNSAQEYYVCINRISTRSFTVQRPLTPRAYADADDYSERTPIVFWMAFV